MKENLEFSVRFWGVRGSYPTPGAQTVRYGGNTPCVEVQVNGYTLIFDAGTGLIGLGRDLLKRARQSGRSIEAAFFFSHLHHDHTQGFPFFTPAFLPTARLHFFGPDFMDSGPCQTLEQVMQPPYFPIRLADLNARMSFSTLRDCDAVLVGAAVGGITVGSTALAQSGALPSEVAVVRVLRSYAHPGGVLHYRVDFAGHSLVYATDTEGYVNGDRRLANFARGADLLIHDAQYTDEHYLGLAPGLPTTQGFGHSTLSIAVDAARQCQVGKLILFHHAPEYDDEQMDRIAQQVAGLLPGALVAQEGLSLDLLPYTIPAGRELDAVRRR